MKHIADKAKSIWAELSPAKRLDLLLQIGVRDAEAKVASDQDILQGRIFGRVCLSLTGDKLCPDQFQYVTEGLIDQAGLALTKSDPHLRLV